MRDRTHEEVVADCRLTVVKDADRSDDVLNAVIGAVGVIAFVLTHGFIEWGPSLTEPRWRVEVTSLDGLRSRTVRTTFTRWAAMRTARRTRRSLVSGSERRWGRQGGRHRA